MAARPFLKWAGGKSQLLTELTRRLPEQFARYHEPFLGGGALFFHLHSQGRLPQGAVLSDVNPELIDTYRAVRDHAAELIDQLIALRPYGTDRDFFYEIRSWDRQPGFAERPLVQRAARTIFLNRTCYNGLYRLNNRGLFNAPFGYYRKPLIVDVENMQAVSCALQTVELHIADFSAVLERARPGDFVYFDPPYVPLTSTSSFTSYTRHGFGEDAQRALAATFYTLATQGCHVMLSNSSTELSRALFAAGYETVFASRKINCVGGKRGLVEELVAVQYAH